MGAPLKFIHATLIALIITTGCSVRDNAPVQNPREVWCDTNQPRRPTVPVIEAMSRAELDEMNAYNARGTAWCGWRP